MFGPLFTKEEGGGGFSRGLCLVSCLLRRSGVLKVALFGPLFTEKEGGSSGGCV